MKELKIRSNEEKERKIRDYLNSEKSISQWCRENNMPISTFHAWLKKYNSSKACDIKFIEIKEPIKKESKKKPIKREISGETKENIIIGYKEFKINVSEVASMGHLAKILKVVSTLDV